MSKILITVRGGVVESCHDDDALEVCIVDYDADPDAEVPEEFKHLVNDVQIEEVAEEQRRDEKHGLHPEFEDPCN